MPEDCFAGCVGAVYCNDEAGVEGAEKSELRPEVLKSKVRTNETFFLFFFFSLSRSSTRLAYCHNQPSYLLDELNASSEPPPNIGFRVKNFAIPLALTIEVLVLLE